tara:strand:- start:71 stop:667 length:597 start_codon:yes stop_codon:yes gene_type:complete
MEVQAHGNIFEDIKTRELTGLGKKEYDKLKKNGYTSAMDIVKGLHSDVDISIKTAQGNSVNCGDILSRRKEKEYDMVVANYTQVEGKKVFHTEYTFHIKPEHEELLWGTMNYNLLNEFNDYIRAYDGTNADRDARKQERQEYQNQIQDQNALMKINPKLSGKQRRTQCTVHIDKLIASGVEYSARPIRITIDSKARNK